MNKIFEKITDISKVVSIGVVDELPAYIVYTDSTESEDYIATWDNALNALIDAGYLVELYMASDEDNISLMDIKGDIIYERGKR